MPHSQRPRWIEDPPALNTVLYSLFGFPADFPLRWLQNPAPARAVTNEQSKGSVQRWIGKLTTVSLNDIDRKYALRGIGQFDGRNLSKLREVADHICNHRCHFTRCLYGPEYRARSSLSAAFELAPVGDEQVKRTILAGLKSRPRPNRTSVLDTILSGPNLLLPRGRAEESLDVAARQRCRTLRDMLMKISHPEWGLELGETCASA